MQCRWVNLTRKVRAGEVAVWAVMVVVWTIDYVRRVVREKVV